VSYSPEEIALIHEMLPDLRAGRLKFREANYALKKTFGTSTSKNALHSYVTQHGYYSSKPRNPDECRPAVKQFFDGLSRCYDWDTIHGGFDER
jgi:hypothetical protein